MDLISKKAAVSRISDLLILELKGKRTPTWNEVYNAIGDIPPVPAVPVTHCKDCINWDTEWTTHPPDHYCPAIDQFTSVDFYCGYAEKKEVEEQDAQTDQPGK